MTRDVLLRACMLLLCAVASATQHRGSNVTITGELEAGRAELITANSDRFWQGLSSGCFRSSRPAQLNICYTRDGSEARQLLEESGRAEEAAGRWYVPSASTLYVWAEDCGDEKSWSALFGGITAHFVRQSAPGAPLWFETGLGRFLGEQGRIEKGGLVIAHPAAASEALTKLMNDQKGGLTVTRLAATTDRQFEAWEAGEGYAQMVFYWLYENGLLEGYITATRVRGFEVAVLEEVTGRPAVKINTELRKFRESVLAALELAAKGLVCEDPKEKKKCLSEALELRPNYQAVRLELAKCFYKEGNIEKSRELLAEIMGASEPVEYRQAAQWMATSF